MTESKPVINLTVDGSITPQTLEEQVRKVAKSLGLESFLRENGFPVDLEDKAAEEETDEVDIDPLSEAVRVLKLAEKIIAESPEPSGYKSQTLIQIAELYLKIEGY